MAGVESSEAAQIARIVFLLAIVLVFIICISLDAVRALNRRAHWIPGHLLVLSALSIQLLNLLCDQRALLYQAVDTPLLSPEDRIKEDLWMIHSSRVMSCVVVAYLLPGMASRGSENFWGKLTALAITILTNTTSELYIVYKSNSKLSTSYLDLWPETKGMAASVFIGSAALISLSFMMLIFLLPCAYVASRGIDGIISQKIPLILGNTSHSESGQEKKEEEYDWIAVKNEVLKAWIVARAYSPEYIIARSPLSSSTAAIVTIQIGITIGGLRNLDPKLVFKGTFDCLKMIVILLQCVFIVIGWAIIMWRWCTAVGYYTRWQKDKWGTAFRVEDFWLRHIKELLQPQLCEAKVLDAKIQKLVAKQPSEIGIPPAILFILLYPLLWLQWAMVLLSKAFWVLSLIIFHNRFMNKLISCMLFRHLEATGKKFVDYENLFKGLEMLRETPESLWIANRSAIAIAEELNKQGEKDGKDNCKELIAFLEGKRTDIGLDPTHDKLHEQGGFKYLWRLTPETLEVEEHFKEASTPSWKMTAMSLITIILHLSPLCLEEKAGESLAYVKNCLKAYSQAWEILNFVEESDIAESMEIMSKAADEILRELESKEKNGNLFRKESDFKSAGEGISELAGREKEKTKPSGGKTFQGKHHPKKLAGWDTEGGNDSVDWKAAAAGNAVYKLCKSIDVTADIDLKELLSEIDSALAGIIYDCIKKVKPALVVNSRIWARQLDENKIGAALYIAGKGKTIMEELERAHNNTLAIVTRP